VCDELSVDRACPIGARSRILPIPRPMPTRSASSPPG
jgi:hypothetical protein